MTPQVVSLPKKYPMILFSAPNKKTHGVKLTPLILTHPPPFLQRFFRLGYKAMEPSRGLCGDFEDGILRGRAFGKSYRSHRSCAKVG